MEKNGFRRIFCILFFALCAIPLAVFLLAGPSAPGASERPAAKPRVISAGRVNWDVLSDAADYFADTFGLRQELITADAQLQAVVLHQSAVDDVLLGADGWLFEKAYVRERTRRPPPLPPFRRRPGPQFGGSEGRSVRSHCRGRSWTSSRSRHRSCAHRWASV